MEHHKTTRSRIMLADDDLDFRCALADALRADGFEVIDLPDGVSVSVFLDSTARDDASPAIDALVTDLRMPHVSGLMLLEQLERLHLDLPVVMITGFDDIATRCEASALGVVALLTKPFELSELEAILDRVTRVAMR
jgi:DNA-binding NtrC family response regulator